MAVFAFIISTGSANVTYTIELERDEKDQGSDLFRRIFFLEGKKVFFSITQQATLAKENELFCEFNHTVYLRVSCSTFPYFFFGTSPISIGRCEVGLVSFRTALLLGVFWGSYRLQLRDFLNTEYFSRVNQRHFGGKT